MKGSSWNPVAAAAQIDEQTMKTHLVLMTYLVARAENWMRKPLRPLYDEQERTWIDGPSEELTRKRWQRYDLEKNTPWRHSSLLKQSAHLATPPHHDLQLLTPRKAEQEKPRQPRRRKRKC